MAGTQNSISSLVAQFLRLQKNALEIINGLNEVATSTNDTVSIEILDENGNPSNANIPSYGYLRGEISRIDSNVRSLAGIDKGSTVRNADGTYSQVFKADPLKNPPAITNLQVPSTFASKDNWFFESFLSPLLYVNLNLTGQVPESADRILVKRIIANITTQAQADFFDSNLKGRNDISHDDFISELEGAGIGYFVDEDIIPLPLRVLRYTGSFSVISFYDDVLSTTDVNGQVVQSTVRNYKLNGLTYTDTSTGVSNGKSLNIGDMVSTQDGSVYLITSVNIDQSSIQIKRQTGYEAIKIGENTLSIFSNDLGGKSVNVDVGYNERQGVFFKSIDDSYNIVSSNWSSGVTFWSNELTTLNTRGELVTLENFYLTDVADIGKVFLDMAKEKKVPAVQGLTPGTPVLDTANFQVVQINKQITDSVSVKVASEKVASKAVIKTEIDSLDVSINQTKAQLNQIKAQTKSTASTSDAVNTVQSKLASLINEKIKKSQLYSSIVKDIQTTTLDIKQINTEPKYRVRGFWPIPAPIFSQDTGNQSVIQFKVRYRYLSDAGSTQPTQQIQYRDNNGQLKTGAFSNWVEISTPIRTKIYDETTGVYIWTDEDTDNADAVNINQLDIPIQKGEKVEIQIASVSEAGWPDNPLTSEYSQSAVVSFPDELSANGISEILATNVEDAAVVRVQEDLNSQGLPQHLSEQFTEATNTYYHISTGIASGFFNTTGGTVSLFEKLTQLQNQLDSLQALISVTVGSLEVSLIDENSSIIPVSKGQNVQIIAGFYNQIFSIGDGEAGKIATKTYLIQLSNPEATPIELSSIVPGGFNTQAPPGTYSPVEGYSSYLKYGAVPISVTTYPKSEVASNTSIYQSSPFACAQTYGQFIYSRYRSVGFDQDLYLGNALIPPFNIGYDYEGSNPSAGLFGLPSGSILPLNGSILVPYDPNNTPVAVAGGTSASIWNGNWSTTAPLGGGFISEFCIHKDHPVLNTGATGGEYVSFVKPNYDNSVTGNIIYPAFRHSIAFFADASLPGHYAQTQYRTPTVAAGPTADYVDIEDSQWQDRISFESNDEYLVGKYSCGAYLFLGPPENTTLVVDGFTALASKIIFQSSRGSNTAVNIPLIFQFRAADKLGYVGGWRKSGTIANITYTKRVGFDIQQRGQGTFSFDVSVTGKFRNDSLIAPNFGVAVEAR
jgi:hypothetical protein